MLEQTEQMIAEMKAMRKAINVEEELRESAAKPLVEYFGELFKNFKEIGENKVDCNVKLDLGKFGKRECHVEISGQQHGDNLYFYADIKAVIVSIPFWSFITGNKSKYRDINLHLTHSPDYTNGRCIYKPSTVKYSGSCGLLHQSKKGYNEFLEFQEALLPHDIFDQVVKCKYLKVKHKHADYCIDKP